MSEIKSIQTYYDGYVFRSRLEARWAVFFNSGLIKYEYEPEGFDLSNGTKYLPDFYLPEYETYVEVKRDTKDGIEEVEKKCNNIIEWGGPVKRLLVLSNVPEGKSPDGGIWHFPATYWHNDYAAWGWGFFYDTPYDSPKVELAFPKDIGSAWYLWRSKKRQTLGPVTDYEFRNRKSNGEFTLEDEIEMQENFNARTFRSFRVARAARFEHGETPPTAEEFKKMRETEYRREKALEDLGRISNNAF